MSSIRYRRIRRCAPLYTRSRSRISARPKMPWSSAGCRTKSSSERKSSSRCSSSRSAILSSSLSSTIPPTSINKLVFGKWLSHSSRSTSRIWGYECSRLVSWRRETHAPPPKLAVKGGLFSRQLTKGRLNGMVVSPCFSTIQVSWKAWKPKGAGTCSARWVQWLWRSSSVLLGWRSWW